MHDMSTYGNNVAMKLHKNKVLSRYFSLKETETSDFELLKNVQSGFCCNQDSPFHTQCETFP